MILKDIHTYSYVEVLVGGGGGGGGWYLRKSMDSMKSYLACYQLCQKEIIYLRSCKEAQSMLTIKGSIFTVLFVSF